MHALTPTDLSDEAEDVNLLGLTNSMSSVHSLQVRLRVPAVSAYGRPYESESSPVGIEKNDNVRCHQVDTQTTRSSGKQEYKLLTSRRIVIVDGIDSVLVSSVSVDSAVFFASQPRGLLSGMAAHGVHGTGSNPPGYPALDSFGRR